MRDSTVIDDEWLETHGRPTDLRDARARVITLITKGLSNAEIATTTYLSINSVKTYIRSTYRKIGSHAAPRRWSGACATGFVPPTEPPAPVPDDLPTTD